METFIVTVSYLAIGVFLRLSGRFPKDFSNSLNLYVIYVSLPALVLYKVPSMEIDKDLWFVALLPWIMVGLNGILIWALSRLFKWEAQVSGCLMLMASLGNTSFLGIPMVRAFFGEQAISYAMIYDQLGSFLALATYGTLVLAIFGDPDGPRPSLRDVIKKIITFPPFIALGIALLALGRTFPAPLSSLLNGLGSTLVPVVMVAVGYQLTPRLEPGTTWFLAVGLFLKLVVSPLAALGLSKVLGLGGIAVDVAIFEAGMPPMVSAGALAIMAGLSPRLTAALVGVGILFSFLTLPILFQLL